MHYLHWKQREIHLLIYLCTFPGHVFCAYQPLPSPPVPSAPSCNPHSYKDFQDSFFPQDGRDHHHTSSFCQYADPVLQLFVSVLFLAGIPGAVTAAFTSRTWGRRPTMVLGGMCFLIGAALMGPATHLSMLILGRIIMGLGVGMSVQCGPLFLSEIAPFHLRGALNNMFQLFITFGILIANLINYANQDLVYGWRINLGLGGAPALLLVLGALVVPETPVHLVAHGHEDCARKTLISIRGIEGAALDSANMPELVVAVAAAVAKPHYPQSLHSARCPSGIPPKSACRICMMHLPS
jgi:MFS transporter, SP family, sugar:H+ symporter